MKKAFAIQDQAILDAAELVLAEIKAIGAEQGETSVSRSILTEIYYELGKISMIRTVFSDNISLKLLKDKRKGSVSLNSFDPNDIKNAVAEAWQASKAAAVDEAEGISAQAENFSFSQGEPKPNLDQMYQQLTGFLEDVKQEYPKISFDSIGVEHQYTERLYANSNGVRLSSSQGLYQLSNMFMAKDGDKTSSFNYFGSIYEDPGVSVVDQDRVQRILTDTQRQIVTEQLEGSFIGDLVITPACLQELLGNVLYGFTSDRALIAGSSPWKDKLGEQVANPGFSLSLIADHPELPAASPISTDGYVTENMPLIQNGILKNFSLSRYGASKTGLERAANSGGIMEVSQGETPLAEMISGVERGILMGRFSGGSPTPAGDLSGVAKNSFLIENGIVTKALSEVMIAGNLAAMLLDISAVSQERESSGYYLLPWVLVEGITISGK